MSKEEGWKPANNKEALEDVIGSTIHDNAACTEKEEEYYDENMFGDLADQITEAIVKAGLLIPDPLCSKCGQENCKCWHCPKCGRPGYVSTKSDKDGGAQCTACANAMG